MAKITVPSLSENKKAGLMKFGLEFVESLTVEEFEHIIGEYLDRHNVLHLATSRNNQPRCTTLEYFNNGLTVYILSEGGVKIGNIKENPAVSYTIADPYHPETDFFSAAGLQVFGIATVFKKNDDPERFAEIYTFFPNSAGLKKQGLYEQAQKVNFNVITIEPETIRYVNYRDGFRKVLWERNGEPGS